MKYDITKHSAPKMSTTGKGQNASVYCSRDPKRHAPLVPMLFPVLAAHIGGSGIGFYRLFFYFSTAVLLDYPVEQQSKKWRCLELAWFLVFWEGVIGAKLVKTEPCFLWINLNVAAAGIAVLRTQICSHE